MTAPLSNTVDGRILVLAASADLAVGYLAKLNASREAELAGVSTDPVAARFVVVDSDEQTATLEPITSARQVRAKLSGACACGDQLACTADGKAIKLASAAAGSCAILVAEEDGVEGQLVLCRGLAAYIKPNELAAYTAADATKRLAVKGDGSATEWVAETVEMPAIAQGADAGKILRVNDTGSAYELTLTLQAAALILANLPTSDPSVAGQLWNDSGTLKISAGA